MSADTIKAIRFSNNKWKKPLCNVDPKINTNEAGIHVLIFEAPTRQNLL